MHHISLALMVFLIFLNFQLVRGIWRYVFEYVSRAVANANQHCKLS